MNLLKTWKKSELAWLVFSIFIILISSMYDKASILEISTGLIGVVYVIIVAKGYNLSNLVGIGYVSIYGIVAWQAKFYGDMIMNVILIPLYIIAFIQWKNHMSKGIVEARTLSVKQSFTVSLIMIGAILSFNFVLIAMGGNYTLADSSNSILTVTALLLTIGRYSQQWICWLINNIISTTMWVVGIQSGSIDTSLSIAILKIIILVNSIWGLIHWLNMSKRQEN